jgi:flavorubredoxin
MKISKGMKIIGLAIAIVLILFVAFAAFMGYVGSDALSSQATGSELLKPDAETGKAIVVYNPGLSGASKDAATQIANDLKARGYEVMLAGVKSEAAANVSGYDVIVAGGPIYGGKPSPSIGSYLQALVPSPGTIVGVFGTGGGHSANENATSEVASLPDGGTLTVKSAVKIAMGDDTDNKCEEFVAELLL